MNGRERVILRNFVPIRFSGGNIKSGGGRPPRMSRIKCPRERQYIVKRKG